MERPVVYVSPACKHSRALVSLIEKTGFADAYAFINVDRERRLPAFVDRVPLLYNAASVVTDEALFEMFSDATSADAKPDRGLSQIEAADSMCGSAFQTAYDVVQDGCSAIQNDSCWRLDENHEKITTPECQPMPERDKNTGA